MNEIKIKTVTCCVLEDFKLVENKHLRFIFIPLFPKMKYLLIADTVLLVSDKIKGSFSFLTNKVNMKNLSLFHV